MFSNGSSPSLGGRSPKLPNSLKNKGGILSPKSELGKFVDPQIELEMLERDLNKVSQVCQTDGTNDDPTI